MFDCVALVNDVLLLRLKASEVATIESTMDRAQLYDNGRVTRKATQTRARKSLRAKLVLEVGFAHAISPPSVSNHDDKRLEPYDFLQTWESSKFIWVNFHLG